MLLLSHHELHHVLSTYGYGVVAAFVALEGTGIPLPGEATLVAAAIVAGTTHELNVLLVVAAAAGGAILGDNIGYWIGRALGYPLLLRCHRKLHIGDSKIKLGQYLFLRHGRKVVFFGRFVAVLRALNGLLAGINRMAWPHFLAADAAGSILWAAVYGSGAYFLGAEIQRLARPAGIAVLVLVVAGAVAAFFILRHHMAELEAAAERALPGSIEQVARRHRFMRR